MALVFADRVKVTTTTTGTGAVALGAAQAGYQDFSVLSDGDTTHYCIVDNATGAWEVGLGTYASAGPSLARTSVLASSTGTAVSFGAGPKDVFITLSAERVVTTDGADFTGPLEVPAGASGAQVPQAQETYGPKNGQIAGMRNKSINGAFGINQRGYISGAATTAGQYTLDRWKVTGTGGVTFSTTNNKTTVTIPSGQTLQQVIEGLNLQTGTYVLSWEGTAQGRIDGGSYGASGSVTASITGGTNTTIEFNAGTVANVQLEPGTIATPFEHRLNELQLCQRYYESGFHGSGLWVGASVDTGYGVLFKVTKRATPAVVVDFSIQSFNISTPTFDQLTITGFRVLGIVSTAGKAFTAGFYTASAEL